MSFYIVVGEMKSAINGF